jgi:O-antigen/teichoic acid export membrane protein
MSTLISASSSVSFRRHRFWSGSALRASLTYADQGIVSAGNFVATLLIARHLTPEDYGIYALLWSVILSLVAIYNALFGYPVSVFCPKLAYRAISAHTTMLLGLAGSSLVALCAFGLLICIPFVRPMLLLQAGAALFGLVLQETMRRILISNFRPTQALAADLARQILLVLLVRAQLNTGHASPGMLLVASAASSVLGMAVQWGSLRPCWPRDLKIISTASDYWGLGRWALGITVLGTVLAQIYPWAISCFAGPKGVAMYQAVVNVVGITNPIMFSTGTLAVSSVALTFAERKCRRATRKVALRQGLYGATLIAPVLAAVIACPERILLIIYGHASQYVSSAPLLRALAISYALLYVGNIGTTLLEGEGRPQLSLKVTSMTAVLALALVVPASAIYGVRGAIISGVVVNACRALYAAIVAFGPDVFAGAHYLKLPR